jgi:uncharacterized protein
LSVVRTAKGLFLVAALFISAGAFAAEPAAPAASPPPSPAALTAADSILAEMGIKQSIALIVPGMLPQLEHTVTSTRPEIKDSLRETLRAIQPGFDKSAQQLYTQTAELLASQMSEKELQDVAAFLNSPSGKKYLAAEPVFMQKFAAIAGPWREQVSTDMMTQAREAMKKKGIDF